jgi:GNAT superfamily N-acetyltransferase
VLTIRAARASDAGRAAEVIAGALAEYDLPFEPEGRDADVTSFGARAEHDDLVAEEGMRFLGVVSVGPHGDPGVAWVSKLFVVASGRRRGVGRALLEAAHEAARARGYVAVALRTRLVFGDAIRLYEKLGYARRGEPSAGDVVYARAL